MSKKWTLSEMRNLIDKAGAVYVKVQCPGHERWGWPFVEITKKQALALLGKDLPRPRFIAYGDGDVVLG